MKEVVIILRPKMYIKTKQALVDAGFSSMTVKEVVGRGKVPMQYELDDPKEGVKYRVAAKKMVTMYVRAEEIEALIDTVIEVNKTNRAGDGKIFILPVEDAIRIRTEQRGVEAVV